MSDCRLIVVSCPKYRPIQDIWLMCQSANWKDCPFPSTVLSPEEDLGWNANLARCLETVSESYVLLLLEDHFIDKSPDGEQTANINAVLELMRDRPDIGMVKLQAGNAHPPEIPFPSWPILREYDRAHHPFKRTNLVPTLFRREWLQRLTAAVLDDCGPNRDRGRKGAIEFEVTGTLLTEDSALWPERMLGIHRPNPDGGGGQSLIHCIVSDGVREGKLQVALPFDVKSVPGIEAFL